MDYTIYEILIRQEAGYRPHYSLILDTDEGKETISFNGSGFRKGPDSAIDRNGFSPLTGYSKEDEGMPIKLVSIKHDWDLFFLVFENGDIFQLFYMMDSEEGPQQLSIYRTGDPVYKWAVSQISEYGDWSFEES